VTYHVHFKLLLLVYKSLNNHDPQYIQEYLQLHFTSGHHLRSCDQGLLKISRTNFKPFGDRTFARSGLLLWNKVPLETVRVQPCVSPSLRTSVQAGLQFVSTFLIVLTFKTCNIFHILLLYRFNISIEYFVKRFRIFL